MTKVNLMVDDIAEKQYVPFMVNRGLSYFKDTIMAANVMNRNYHLDHKVQYSYLINSIAKKKRFSKWIKPDESNDLMIVKEYYGYSNEKARSALTILSSDQISKLKNQLFKGGRSSQKLKQQDPARVHPG